MMVGERKRGGEVVEEGAGEEGVEEVVGGAGADLHQAGDALVGVEGVVLEVHGEGGEGGEGGGEAGDFGFRGEEVARGGG